MENANFVHSPAWKISLVFLACILSIAAFEGCASRKPQFSASQYRFEYSGETYRIRSIVSDDGAESYNELIGGSFLAADYDQDRIIDAIVLGDMSLSEAQTIYEYGLNKIAQADKLQVRNPAVIRYVYESDGLRLEICSFRPGHAPPFNEFKVIPKRQMFSPQVVVAVDRNADGRLDEVLKGAVALEEVQLQYAEMIEAGLQSSQLVRINGMILVKQK